MFCFKREGQSQLLRHEEVMISHRKSKEVINIAWFGHTSLPLFLKKGQETDVFPVLQNLTHMDDEHKEFDSYRNINSCPRLPKSIVDERKL